MRKSILLLSTLLMQFGSGVTHASTLSDAANALQPGEWVQLTTTGLNEELLQQGSHWAMQFMESMKWDPVRQELHFVGSGHLEPYVHIVYSESSNSWSERPLPFGGNSHGYDHMALDPVGRKFYFRGFNSGQLEIYDLDQRSWSRSSTIAAGNWAVASGMAWVPGVDGVLFSDPVRISLYRPDSDTWSTVSNNTSGLGQYHNFAEYSPVHDVTLYGGGNGSNTIYRRDQSGNVSSAANAPVGIGIHQSVNVADPVTGNLLVFSSNEMHEYNPSTNQWSSVNVSIPYQNGAEPGVVGLAAAPISTHGVVMLVKYDFDNTKAFLYRHTAGVGVGAPLPTIPNPPIITSGSEQTGN